MRLAARGTREAEGGEQRILERAERAALRRRARRLLVQAVLLSAAGVGLTLALRLLAENAA